MRDAISRCWPGYDQMLGPAYFAASGPHVNIHPSLLPLHGGRGMVGLAVHAAVLAAGEVETGVTIHDVTSVLDAGPPIRQVRCPSCRGVGLRTCRSRARG